MLQNMMKAKNAHYIHITMTNLLFWMLFIKNYDYYLLLYKTREREREKIFIIRRNEIQKKQIHHCIFSFVRLSNWNEIALSLSTPIQIFLNTFVSFVFYRRHWFLFTYKTNTPTNEISRKIEQNIFTMIDQLRTVDG